MRLPDLPGVRLLGYLEDGAGGSCRVRLWAANFQSDPSFTSTRIQLPVILSPGFKLGFLL
jgi:hypothetical protein